MDVTENFVVADKLPGTILWLPKYTNALVPQLWKLSFMVLPSLEQSFFDSLFSYYQPPRHSVTSSLLPRYKRGQSKDSGNYFSFLCNLGSIPNVPTFL